MSITPSFKDKMTNNSEEKPVREQETSLADYEELFKEFPAEARQALRIVWDSLPATTRKDMVALSPTLSGDIAKLRKVMQLARTQLEMAFGYKHNVAIVGPANVGKSTLYNQFIQSKGDKAAVSPVPGTTRENQEAETGLFTVVDTPGADAVGEVGAAERERAMRAAVGADFLVIMFDAVQGIKRTEQELFNELKGLGKPYIVVLNKMDLVKKEAKQVLAQTAANLGLPVEQVIPLVAEDGKNLDTVVSAIVKAEPELVVALGQALPAYRWQLAWRTITGAASTAAVIALTPLPFLDFIPLVALQSSLVLGIARIYEYEITPARAKELVGTFGLGLLGRTLFQELVKLGGPPGWVVAAAVAASTTVVMGYAATIWFERGERLTSDNVKRLSEVISRRLVERLKGFGRKRPSRETLREEIIEVLDGSPMAGDRAALDREANETEG